MSLVGEVSGVGLAELLQVAALSGGRSMLEICSGGTTAWLGFEAGAIVRFARSDLELGDEEKSATDPDRPGADEEAPVSQAEEALLDLFHWTDGSFVLHCGEEVLSWPGPEGIRFRVPVRAESVALGAARRMDEERRGGAASEPSEPKRQGGPRPFGGGLPVVVMVDPDTDLLSAVKEGLSGDRARVHTFFRSPDAWFRLQQYLMRGEVPTLVMDSSVQDPVEPGCKPGWRRFAARLHGIAPSARVVLLASDPMPSAPSLHSVIRRPVDPAGTGEEIRELVGTLGRVLGLDA